MNTPTHLPLAVYDLEAESEVRLVAFIDIAPAPHWPGKGTMAGPTIMGKIA